MRIVMQSLLAAIPSLLHTSLVLLVFFWIWAIVGVEMFKGRLQRCENLSSGSILPLSSDMCEAGGGVWKNPDLGSFDHLGAAMLILFEISTLEGWTDVMWATVDATSAGLPPLQDYDITSSLYILSFIIFGSLFLVSLFMGVVVDEYKKNVEKRNGIITEQQKKWMDFYRTIISNRPQDNLKPPIEERKLKLQSLSLWDRLRQRSFNILNTQQFDKVVLALILLNMIIMAMDYDGAPDPYTTTLTFINYTFTVAFFFEMVIKLMGLGVKQYFTSKWNVFDFMLIIYALFQLFLEQLFDSVDFFNIKPAVFRGPYFDLAKLSKLKRYQLIVLDFSPVFYVICFKLYISWFPARHSNQVSQSVKSILQSESYN
uniref:Ion transport domain-containing protein n=1 Tax=Spongospora subterranea TaxID=70186 RepID=A0A0H5RAT4_9EUKA|eukprot:CRZ05569.1 hypothetical protein [Spongospora subterranea]